MKSKIKVQEVIPSNLGPEGFNSKLFINPLNRCIQINQIVSIDVETDEQNNFVGIAICYDENEVEYYTNLNLIKSLLENHKLIGHGFKFDMHMLKKWGINVHSDQMFFDTSISSYVIDSTKDSHHLKDLAKEILHMEYPTYKQMVGKGRNKRTLDKQPIEEVGKYCGCDALATWRLYKHFDKIMTTQQKSIFNNLEMPILRLLYKMEEQGINVDVPYLQKLGKEWKEELDKIESSFTFNTNSPKQVKEWLESKLIYTETTNKVFLNTLNDSQVKLLLRQRELAKLYNTYIKGLLSLSTLPKVHTRFSQTSSKSVEMRGIRTGRLSSSSPNLQNIPTRTEMGNKLRKAFIPEEGKVFLVGDYSQIEYRLLAHFTQEPVLLQAFKENKDVHEETGRILGVSRYLGKTLNFATIYGASPKKIASTVNTNSENKITEEQAETFLSMYWKRLPRVKSWVEKVKLEALQNKGVKTLAGRWIRIRELDSNNMYIRWHAERQAVNYIIQGSAADIIKIAMLVCDNTGYTPTLQIHDELIFELDEKIIPLDRAKNDISLKMQNIVKLSVPVIVDIGVGKNWSEAKQR